MRITEMAERLARQVQEQGGPLFVRLTESGFELTGADPQWRPAPESDGSLVQDPEFTLPSTAGPVSWRLFHDSQAAGESGPWGYGRRASFPLKLTSDGITVTVTHEDGTRHQYRDISTSTLRPIGGNYDQLVKNADGSWDETLIASGIQYHFPAGNNVSVSYRQTPHGRRLSYNYDAAQRLESLVEPAGRRVTLGYAAAGLTTVQYVQDWGDRRNTLAYDASSNMVEEQGPTGCITQYDYDANHRIAEITDPEGYVTSYSWDSAGRVLTRSVAGNLGRYTYQLDANQILTMGYEDPLGRIWTHTRSATGNPLRRIDPLGNRETFNYLNFRPFGWEDSLGNKMSFQFDGNGFERAIRDPLGNRTSYARDGYGNIRSVINALGHVTTMGYGANPALRQAVTVMNALGHIRTYGYTEWGAREFEEDPLGFRTTWQWTNLGLMEAEINALGFRRTFVHDLVANRTAEVDPLGNRWSFYHDQMGRVTARENPLGFRHSTLYDARGMVQAEIDPLGFRTSHLWNAEGSRTGSINALGHRTSWQYDAANQMIAQQDALGYRTTQHWDRAARLEGLENALGFRNTTVWDAAGRAIAQIDALGFRSSSVYDAAGRPEASINARGYRNTTVYDAASQAIGQVDALGNRWTAVYDPLGRQEASVDPLGNRASQVFDARDLLSASVDPLANRTSMIYDAAQQQIATQDARGYRVTTVFDAAGRAAAYENPVGNRTSMTFDAASRQIGMQDALGFRHSTVFDAAGRVGAGVNPLGSRTSFVMDALGRQIAAVDALGRRTSVVFDALNRAVAQQDARGYFSTVVYDAIGARLALVDANAGRWSTSYDPRGFEGGTMDPLGARHTFDHDPAGNRTLRVDARGWPTTYGFDALDRETTRLYRDGGRVSHSLDALGRPVAIGDRTGTTSHLYDAASRETGVVYPTGIRLTYGLDAAGNRLSLDDITGRTSYERDPAGRLSLIVNPYAERTSMSWDALDRELKKTLANGMTVSHTYDPAGSETLLENRKADGTGLAVYTSTYDAVMNRLTLQELDGVRVTYGYDPSYQLVNEQRSGVDAYNTTYDYDGIGNRLRKIDSGAVTSYQYNIAQELTLMQPPSGRPTTSTWDANGNLALENAGGALTSYTWCDENRLTKVEAPGGTEIYAYAADGKRRKKETGSGVLLFAWDGENLLVESDTSLVVQARYTDFPGFWGGLASQRRSGASSFYGFDPQASARILVSIGGAVTDSYVFKAFGEEITASGATGNPHRYVGAFAYYRDSLERVYVRARHLRPALGRWMSSDLEHEPTTFYLYVVNRPTLWTDPSGRQPPAPTPNFHFNGCSQHQREHLTRAITAICKFDWSEAEELHKAHCLDPKFKPKCFSRFCQGSQPLVITCGGKGGDCSAAKNLCGFTPHPGVGNVTVCDRSFPPKGGGIDPVNPNCFLPCLILHELLHACGQRHTGIGVPNNPTGPSDDCYCFNAMSRVAPYCDESYVTPKGRKGWRDCSYLACGPTGPPTV